tara:strand:- start:41 stop:274 length:234 start_codon:yes stop_codon:yes gene_type:complete
MTTSIYDFTNRELIDFEYNAANGDGTTDLSSELGVRLGQVLTDLELLLNEFETITDNTLIKSGEGYKSIDEIRKHLK